MTETPGSADESPARDTSPGAPARRLRVRMSTLMVFVLTAAVASALFVELRRLLKPMGSSARVDIDVPTVLIIGLALNAAALGALRRLAPVQVLVQISVCCLLFLTGVWACEWQLWRALRYWLQACFAATVVVPLLARRAVADGRRDERRDRRIAWIDTVLLSFLNFVMILVVACFELIVLFNLR